MLLAAGCPLAFISHGIIHRRTAVPKLAVLLIISAQVIFLPQCCHSASGLLIYLIWALPDQMSSCVMMGPAPSPCGKLLVAGLTYLITCAFIILKDTTKDRKGRGEDITPASSRPCSPMPPHCLSICFHESNRTKHAASRFNESQSI